MINHKRSKASKPLWKGITHYYKDHRNEQWYNQIQAHKRNMVTQTTVDMANIKWMWHVFYIVPSPCVGKPPPNWFWVSIPPPNMVTFRFQGTEMAIATGLDSSWWFCFMPWHAMVFEKSSKTSSKHTSIGVTLCKFLFFLPRYQVQSDSQGLAISCCFNGP